MITSLVMATLIAMKADSADTTYARPIRVEEQGPTISVAPIKTENVSQHDLQKAACCSLAESFEKSPTVEVSFSDAATGARQIQMLGLRGLYSQLLVETLPIVRGLETPYALDHVPGSFMESISISKGTATVTTGHEAITGQINVCLKNPADSPSLFVNLYGNTMQRWEANIISAQQLSDYWSASTMVHGRIMDAPTDSNNDGFIDLSQFKQLNIVERVRYNDDKFEFQGYLRGLNDNYYSGSYVASADGGHSGHIGSDFRIETEISHVDAFTKFGWLDVFSFADESSVAATISGVVHQQNTSFPNRVLFGKQQTFSAKTILSATLSDELKVIGGLSYSYDNVAQQLDTINLNRQEHEPGIYAEATMNPVDDLTLITGLRVDANSLFGTRVVPRVHMKYALTGLTSLRVSAGRGWRTANAIIDNMSSFINYRTPIIQTNLLPEDAWNVGGSITTNWLVDNATFTLDAEVYHTNFTNQVLVDLDQSARTVVVSNINGKSYSTQAMVQLLTTPITGLDLLLAYRYTDIQAPYAGQQRATPMVSLQRLLFTASYSWDESRWQADATVSRNNGGRLPSTVDNPSDLQRPTTFPGYWRFSGQITKRFKLLNEQQTDFDVYVGIENAGDFIQKDPVISSTNPTSQYFDASLTWGPLDMRTIYAGVRFTL